MEDEIKITTEILEAIKKIALVSNGQLSFDLTHIIEKDFFKKGGFKITRINIEIRKQIC